MKYFLLIAALLVLWPMQVKADLVSLANDVRTQRGHQALKVNQKLNEVAQRRAEYVLKRGVLDHYNWSSFYRGQGFCFVGENLAVYYKTDEKIMQGWRESQSHFSNLVGRYREVGVGRVKGKFQGYDTEVVVMSFGIKCF